MNLGDSGKALIQRFESCRLRAYPDPGTGGAPWTVGWGHTGMNVGPTTVWSQAMADANFASDAQRFVDGVTKLVGASPTTQDQFDAMTCLAYNIGLGNFGASTLLKKHKAEDYAGAQAEFSKWNKAAGRVLPGLVTRRTAESKLYGGDNAD